MLTATLNESRSCKLTTASGSAFHCTMASGKRSTCSSSDLFESGGRSLNGSNGICDECVEHIQGGVRLQVHTLSYKRDIDGRQPVFALGFSSLAG